MISDNSIRKAKLAAVIAGFILLVHGIAYQSLAARLQGPLNVSPLDPNALKTLPLEIADWTGHDIPMDKEIVSVLDNEAFINRLYSRDNGTNSVVLFFSCGYSGYERIIHRPEICYPSAGWKVVSEHALQLTCKEGENLPYTMFRFSKTDVEMMQSAVLHYYVVDGKPLADIQILRPRLWRLFNRINYVARVLITTSDYAQSEKTREQILKDFAVDSAPFIEQLLDDIEKGRNSNENLVSPGGN